MRPSRERIDLSVYVRAFGVFAKNPTVIVVPLLANVVAVLIGQISGASGGGTLGGLTEGILLFVLQLLTLFALGASVIIADQAWRHRGTASFEDAWQEARQRGGDILFAAFGFTFVLNIAQYAATILGGLGFILSALAAYALIYTIPAAAIGGIPGSAAIGVSVERVRSAPLTSAFLAIAAIVLVFYFGAFLGAAVDQWLYSLFGGSALAVTLADAVLRSIAIGYLAIVMARVYSDVSFTTPRW